MTQSGLLADSRAPFSESCVRYDLKAARERAAAAWGFCLTGRRETQDNGTINIGTEAV